MTSDFLMNCLPRQTIDGGGGCGQRFVSFWNSITGLLHIIGKTTTHTSEGDFMASTGGPIIHVKQPVPFCCLSNVSPESSGGRTAKDDDNNAFNISRSFLFVLSMEAMRFL